MNPLRLALALADAGEVWKLQRQASDFAVTVEDHFPDRPAGRESQRDIHHGVTTELPGGWGTYALEAADGTRHLRPRAGEPVRAHASAQARVQFPVHLLPAALDEVAAVAAITERD